MPAWLAPAIEATGAIASNVATGLFASRENKKNREFQERMYYQQLEDNRRNWEMVNEYNNPSAAYARELEGLKVNGLNPLLAYGQGSNIGGSAQPIATGNAPSGSAPSVSFSNPFAGFTKGFEEMSKLEAEIDLMKAQEEKTLNESLLASAEYVKTHSEREKIESETEYNIRSMESRLEILHTENRLKRLMGNTEESKKREIDKNIDQIDANIDWINTQAENSVRMTDQQIAESKTRVENSIKLTCQQIKTMKAEEQKALADAWYAREKAKTESLVRDDIHDKYLQEIRNLIASGDAQELENVMKAYAWEKMPAPGSKTWKYQKWIENYVTPITSSLGNLLGGAIAGTGAAMIKKM